MSCLKVLIKVRYLRNLYYIPEIYKIKLPLLVLSVYNTSIYTTMLGVYSYAELAFIG
jgi:hypothetical protein